MGTYSWEEYYENVWEWTTREAVDHIAEISSFGSSEEIWEVINEIAFNLQGTEQRPPGVCRSSDSLCILSHLRPFVKNFFQVFQTFFEAVFRLPRFSPKHQSILSQSILFVKNFFQIS